MATEVAWQPWTRAAFERAAARKQPVLLYVSAHWCAGCRQLEEGPLREPDIVRTIEELFVPVRLDVDERPDIANLYHMGSVPSLVFLTEKAEIIWGATLLEGQQLRALLPQFAKAYETSRERVLQEVREREERIRKIEAESVTGRSRLATEIVGKTVSRIVSTFDPVYGGFGTAPKFPAPDSLEVLLDAHWETRGEDLREVIAKTLDAILDRGLFDAEEGGFFRYAAKESWGMPQTEKLCADNARLIRVYLRAARLVGRVRYEEAASRALEWARRTLFDGNLFRASQAADPAYGLGRRRASPPPVDPRAFTDSNAEMVSTLVLAWAVLGAQKWLDAAVSCGRALRKARLPDGGVSHLADGNPRVSGLLRDAVLLARAWLDLYEGTGEEAVLRDAESIAAAADRAFRLADGCLGHRLRSPGDVGALSEPRKLLDDNALAAEVLCRLAVYTGQGGYHDRAREILEGFPDIPGTHGHATAAYARAVYKVVRPPLRLEVTGRDPSCIRTALAVPAPWKIVRHSEGRPGLYVLDQSGGRRPVTDEAELRHAIEELR